MIIHGSKDTYLDIAFDFEMMNAYTQKSPPVFNESKLSERIS